MKYGVSNAARAVCKIHEQAFPVGETCPWCIVKPWHSTLENVAPPESTWEQEQIEIYSFMSTPQVNWSYRRAKVYYDQSTDTFHVPGRTHALPGKSFRIFCSYHRQRIVP